MRCQKTQPSESLKIIFQVEMNAKYTPHTHNNQTLNKVRVLGGSGPLESM